MSSSQTNRVFQFTLKALIVTLAGFAILFAVVKNYRFNGMAGGVFGGCFLLLGLVCVAAILGLPNTFHNRYGLTIAAWTCFATAIAISDRSEMGWSIATYFGPFVCFILAIVGIVYVVLELQHDPEFKAGMAILISIIYPSLSAGTIFLAASLARFFVELFPLHG